VEIAIRRARVTDVRAIRRLIDLYSGPGRLLEKPTRPRILLSGANAPVRLSPFEKIILLLIAGIAAFIAYTAYQRLTGDIQMRVRLRETINDPEPFFHLRNVSAEPLLPGAVALNGVPEGLFSKALIGGIRTIEPEPPPPDQLEVTRRYAMVQAGTFMVAGAAEFAKALEPKMHAEVLLKNPFFSLVDVTVTIIGVAGKSWSQPIMWVNRSHMLALYLG